MTESIARFSDPSRTPTILRRGTRRYLAPAALGRRRRASKVLAMHPTRKIDT